MTSTKFNIGLSENRSSSRVLRPPGGGHTDIFGIRDLPEPKAVTVPKPVAPETVEQPAKAGHLSAQDVQPPCESVQATDETAQRATNGEIEAVKNSAADNSSPSKMSMNGEDISISTTDSQISAVEEAKKQPEQPMLAPVQRKRVPPGGYSSGLW